MQHQATHTKNATPHTLFFIPAPLAKHKRDIKKHKEMVCHTKPHSPKMLHLTFCFQIFPLRSCDQNVYDSGHCFPSLGRGPEASSPGVNKHPPDTWNIL